YGVNDDDCESGRPWVRGFVVRELSSLYSNHRAAGALADYLDRNGIIGVQGIDTRALVRLTRVQGALKGILSTVDLDDAALVARAKASPGLVGRDLAREVMPAGATEWAPGLHDLARNGDAPEAPAQRRPHVVALDFGMKWNIPRHLVARGCRVTV